VIKYIGSKRVLVPRIAAVAGILRDRLLSGEAPTALDPFCGTTRVAQALKREGFTVTASDMASYAEVLAATYIATDGSRVRRSELQAKLDHLNALDGVPGYFTQVFCEEARYFQPFNGARIDAMRTEIERIAVSREERAILLTALMEAADRVDSTTGLQMAYLKQWAPRSFNPISLRMPELVDGPGVAHRADANALVPTLEPVDLVYLDPPYNQHSYHSNYHVWETLIRNDAPEAYGVARKRVDCRTVKSAYNSRVAAWRAFESLVRSVKARTAIVSFSDEGFFGRSDIEQLLGDAFGDVVAMPHSHPRYVGAKIGIYNPKGERVGRVSHVRNREYLFAAGEGVSHVLPDAEAA